MIYIIIFIILLFLSFRYDIAEKTKYKNQWYYVILIVFILLAGLRYRLGVDTTRYILHFYHDTPLLYELSLEDLSFGKDPLFVLFNSLILTLGGKFYIVQLFHAAFVNCLLFIYFKRHSKYIFICVLFYFMWMFYPLNMEEMRASISVTICLYANDYIIQKKWIKGVLLFVISCFFHASTIVVLLMIAFYNLRFNRLGVVVVAVVFIGGLWLQSLLDDYLFLFDPETPVGTKAERYLSNDDMMVGSLNIFGYIGKISLCVYALFALLVVRKLKDNQELLNYESLLMLYILFSVLGIAVPLSYRFVRFYAIYNILFTSYFFVYLYSNNKLSKGIAYVKGTVVLIPFLYFMIAAHIKKTTLCRFYPYASVIDKSIDKNRELVFSEFNGYEVHPNEY